MTTVPLARIAATLVRKWSDAPSAWSGLLASWDLLDGTKTSRKNKRAKARAVYLMPEVVEAPRRERMTYLE